MTVVAAYKYASNPQEAAVDGAGVVDWSRAKAAISEYDPVAIQLGREVADANGTELVGISVGGEAVASSLAKKAALSRGLDRALVVADDATAEWNATTVGKALAALVTKVEGANLVLTGDSSIDEAAKIMPAVIAAALGWPCFQEVTEITADGEGWVVTHAFGTGTRTVKVSGPVVAAIATDAQAVKVPGMKDILAAGKKPLEQVALGDLAVEVTPASVTGRAKPVAVARKQQKFAGEDAAAQLVAALRDSGVL
ncbi:MAG: electron transfer flavoprotein beta subunit/FixA family protein [Arcanobacterium sp.]|nr:electron transfer flavoprotein beta subunit/FixA family protein [Arcanobacterium sp.]